MMAPEFTPVSPELDPATLDALKCALMEYSQSGKQPVALEQSLARVAAEARQRGLRAEQLLLLLKDVWYAIPQIDRAASVDEQNRMLQRIVSLCIRAYYAT